MSVEKLSKICTACKLDKAIQDYYKCASKCKLCTSLLGKEKYKNNSEPIKARVKLYRQNNKEKKAACDRAYERNNKEKVKARKAEYWSNRPGELKAYKDKWYADNKERISADKKIKTRTPEYKAQRNANERRRKLEDPVYRLRTNISKFVGSKIRKNGSIQDILPYSIEELKTHLESQFEKWMEWGNWGKYNANTWKDNESSTWTWQIDHIIPQCQLPYASVDDENFSKCWALSNLRPRSAKENILAGVKMSRSKK